MTHLILGPCFNENPPYVRAYTRKARASSHVRPILQKDTDGFGVVAVRGSAEKGRYPMVPFIDVRPALQQNAKNLCLSL